MSISDILWENPKFLTGIKFIKKEEAYYYNIMRERKIMKKICKGILTACIAAALLAGATATALATEGELGGINRLEGPPANLWDGFLETRHDQNTGALTSQSSQWGGSLGSTSEKWTNEMFASMSGNSSMYSISGDSSGFDSRFGNWNNGMTNTSPEGWNDGYRGWLMTEGSAADNKNDSWLGDRMESWKSMLPDTRPHDNWSGAWLDRQTDIHAQSEQNQNWSGSWFNEQGQNDWSSAWFDSQVQAQAQMPESGNWSGAWVEDQRENVTGNWAAITQNTLLSSGYIAGRQEQRAQTHGPAGPPSVMPNAGGSGMPSEIAALATGWADSYNGHATFDPLSVQNPFAPQIPEGSVAFGNKTPTAISNNAGSPVLGGTGLGGWGPGLGIKIDGGGLSQNAQAAISNSLFYMAASGASAPNTSSITAYGASNNSLLDRVYSNIPVSVTQNQRDWNNLVDLAIKSTPDTSLDSVIKDAFSYRNAEEFTYNFGFLMQELLDGKPMVSKD